MIGKIWYRHLPHWKYQLTRPLECDTPFRPNEDIVLEAPPVQPPKITLTTEGKLRVEGAYAWDGCSGPTIDTRDSMRAGAVHDAIYALFRAQLLARTDFNRKAADDLFKKILKEDGMNELRVSLWHSAVRVFGKSSTNPKMDKKYRKEHEAP